MSAAKVWKALRARLQCGAELLRAAGQARTQHPRSIRTGGTARTPRRPMWFRRLQMIGVAGTGLILLPGGAFSGSEADGALADPEWASETKSGLPISRRSLLILGGLGVAAAVAKEHEDADRTARLIERSGLDLLVDVGNEFGDGVAVAGGTAGLVLAGHLFDLKRVSAAGSDLARSFLWSGAIVWSLKLAVNARRPDGGRYSFPSGHTASAFAVAPIVGKHWGRTAGACAFALSAGTALGRMEDRRHHLADVLFGAAIGLAVGLEVARSSNEGNPGGLLRPLRPLFIAPRAVGLSLSF